MRIVATILGATAGFVFMAASAAMNWMFMIAQGKTVLEGQVLGLVSIAIDVVKRSCHSSSVLLGRIDSG